MCVNKTIASLMATVAARVVSTSTRITGGFPDGSVERKKVCGNIDYCGPDAFRNGNFVDEVNGYTCTLPCRL